MDIIQRNLFALLRSGALGSNEELEAMSSFKWECLYQLAVMHEVVPYAYKGLRNCRDQFFLRLTDKQWKEWQADAFSSSLLMPETMVKSVAGDYDAKSSSQIAEEFLIADVARTFDVTISAAKVRLTTLGIIWEEDRQLRRQIEETDIVKLMRERSRQRKMEEDVYDMRDLELWGYEEKRTTRRRKK